MTSMIPESTNPMLDGAHVRVAIVGAGFAGIGAAIRLKRRGEASFVILERASRVGGTWRDNTYPGIACDVPSHLYSFSFAPNPEWSRFYAPGHEIKNYLEACVQRESLTAHLRLGTDLTNAHWDEETKRWMIETSRGTLTADTLLMAAGRLTTPRIPPVPGATEFMGEWFHSARWNHDAQLAGKRIGIIGSGASAIQLVPELAKVASELVVMQRSAPYVIPRDDASYSAAQQRTFARLPETMAALRSKLFWQQEQVYAQRLSGSRAVDEAREHALGHLQVQVTDAKIREQLTPNYEIGCKRVLISSTYYPTFNSEHVHLQPTALAAVEGNTLVGADESRFDVDVLVYATGFLTARQPFASRIFGRAGTSLADTWSNGMRGYASTTVHGFPNFFVLNGPNAGLGHSSAIYMIETQIEYVLGALSHLDETGAASLEVRAEAEQNYVDSIDSLSAETVWMNGGCSSWYVDPAAKRLTLLWPDFAHAFRAANERFDESVYLSVPASSSVAAPASDSPVA